MDREALCAPDTQFMLAGIATITVPQASTFQGAQGALRLLFARSGECVLTLGDRREHLIGDRMALLRGVDIYRVEEASEDLLLLQVDFSRIPCVSGAYSLHQLYAQYPDYRLYCHSEERCLCFHDRYALVRFTVQGLGQYAAFEPPQRQLHLSLSLSYLMLAIVSAAQEKSQPVYQCSRHVRRAVQYMHDHYMRSITADDIAAHVGIHTGHLHRLFRTEIGTRVTEYLTRLRLDKAKDLLKRTDIPIAVIASLVGISTQQYLSRLFGQHVGMTPQTYRRTYNITCDYEAAQERYAMVTYGADGRAEAVP